MRYSQRKFNVIFGISIAKCYNIVSLQKAVTLIVYEKNKFKVQNDTSLTSDIFRIFFAHKQQRNVKTNIIFGPGGQKRPIQHTAQRFGRAFSTRIELFNNWLFNRYFNKILHREIVSIASECLKHLQCAVFNIHFAYAVKFLNFRVLASYWKLTVVKHLKTQENFKRTTRLITGIIARFFRRLYFASWSTSM